MDQLFYYLRLNLKNNTNIYFAGQITGVEGYVESISSGLVAGINAVNMLKNTNLYGGIVYSQKVLLKLVEKGLTREDAYKIVQKAGANMNKLYIVARNHMDPSWLRCFEDHFKNDSAGGIVRPYSDVEELQILEYMDFAEKYGD